MPDMITTLNFMNERMNEQNGIIGIGDRAMVYYIIIDIKYILSLVENSCFSIAVFTVRQIPIHSCL